MKPLFALALWVCVIALAEDTPRMMTKLTVKLDSSEVPKDSFAREPKRIYRAGFQYCRIEENADLKEGIHGLVVINEPNVWMVNRLNKTARHFVDSEPTYRCRMPMFANGKDIKPASDQALTELEFGRELEYFRPKAGAPKPGPALRNKPTMVYVVQVEDSQLFLFTEGDPERPVAVVRTKGELRETYWYGEYTDVPFDASLFAKPEGVNIEESRP